MLPQGKKKKKSKVMATLLSGTEGTCREPWAPVWSRIEKNHASKRSTVFAHPAFSPTSGIADRASQSAQTKSGGSDDTSASQAITVKGQQSSFIV
jgi:hypothetical protein